MTGEQSSRTGDQLVLVTSVGVGRYEEVTYRLEGFPARKCRILPEALADWLKPDLTLVLLTSEAKKHKNWNELEDALKKDKRSFEPVDIPDGKDKDELWKIFDELKEHLKPGDRVVLDITHAFRSLPVLTLLALTYLRVATGIVLERILYGAFEARDEACEAPVFDLTPFVSLLQWSAAVSLFRQTGECGPFADLLEEKLKNPARSLRKLSDALSLIRTKDIAPCARKVRSDLNKAKKVKEFALLVPLLEDEIGRLAELNADEPSAQLDLADWYFQKGKLVHTWLLAREAVVSHVAKCSGWDVRKSVDRERAENALNDLRRGRQRAVDPVEDRERAENALNEDAAKEKGDVPASGGSFALQELPEGLVKAWSTLAGLRNDIAHCGFRDDAAKVRALKRNILELLENLRSELAPQGQAPRGPESEEEHLQNQCPELAP